jgi:hypothetical protein
MAGVEVVWAAGTVAETVGGSEAEVPMEAAMEAPEEPGDVVQTEEATAPAGATAATAG